MASNKPVILIVDDDFSSYYLIKEILLPYNIEILYAESGTEAIEICINRKDVSLILMDIKMKGLNGFETAVHIKKIARNIPVIFQTAFAREFRNDDFMQDIGDGYLEKPIRENLLIQEIKPFLRQGIFENNKKKVGFLQKLLIKCRVKLNMKQLALQ